MQTRFNADADVEFPERLAGGLMNQGVYIGPEVERELALQANKIDITVNQDSSEQSFSGVHPNQNNFPQDPVYWLINYMTKRGTTFKKGEVIITGSYASLC
jgi:2-keto-4-pentenoate hydratase